MQKSHTQACPDDLMHLFVYPGNNIFASRRVAGDFAIDFTEGAQCIDFDSTYIQVECDQNCTLPDSCDLNKIFIRQPTNVFTQVVIQMHDSECELPRGYGKNFTDNSCHDNYTQLYKFLVTLKLKNTAEMTDEQAATFLDSQLTIDARYLAENAKDETIWIPHDQYHIAITINLGQDTILDPDFREENNIRDYNQKLTCNFSSTIYKKS